VRCALLLLSLCLSACGLIGDPPIYVQVEVWNRTLDPIWLIDQDGERLDVPACGNAFAPRFRVNLYAIWFDKGRYVQRQEGGGARPPNERIAVLSPRMSPILDLPASGPLPELPPCEGHLTVEDEF
jgi:hypothetical protein